MYYTFQFLNQTNFDYSLEKILFVMSFNIIISVYWMNSENEYNNISKSFYKR